MALRRAILGACVLTVSLSLLLLGTWYWIDATRAPAVTPVPQRHSAADVASPATGSDDLIDTVSGRVQEAVPKPVAAAVSDGEADVIRRFESSDARARRALVTDLQYVQGWPEDVRRFMRERLADPGIDDVTRNNIANGLLFQEPRDEATISVLAKIIEDPGQAEVARSYAVQHYASALTRAADPAAMVSLLERTAQRERNSIGATALLQLPGLYRSLGINGDVAQQVIDRTLGNSQAGRIEVLAALSAAADLGDPERAPAIRALITRGGSSGELRHAAAALGAVGDATDLQTLDALARHDDRLVAAAATAAADRLNLRLNGATQ